LYRIVNFFSLYQITEGSGGDIRHLQILVKLFVIKYNTSLNLNRTQWRKGANY